MLSNNKGGLGGVEIAMIAVLIGSFTLGAAEKKFSIYENMFPKFRKRKAIELCIETEDISDADCKELIDGKSRSEILAYIKDDEISGNGGVIQ